MVSYTICTAIIAGLKTADLSGTIRILAFNTILLRQFSAIRSAVLTLIIDMLFEVSCSML